MASGALASARPAISAPRPLAAASWRISRRDNSRSATSRLHRRRKTLQGACYIRRELTQLGPGRLALSGPWGTYAIGSLELTLSGPGQLTRLGSATESRRSASE